MRRLMAFLFLGALAQTALGGIACITVEQSGNATTYRLNGQVVSLPQIRQFIERSVQSAQSVSPKMEVPLNVVPVGATPAEALIPLFVCLKQAGKRSCTLNVSKQFEGKNWGLQLNIDLDRVTDSDGDWRQQVLRNSGINNMTKGIEQDFEYRR